MKSRWITHFVLGIILGLCLARPLRGEEPSEPFMHGMCMDGMYGPYPMDREASGTSWQPEGIPMGGMQWMKSDWMLMFHGYATGTFDQQEGPRGNDQYFGTNMAMFMTGRSWGRHTFGTHSMLTLEPATIGKDGYPLLVQ